MEEKIEIMNLLQNKQLLEHELQSLAYGSVEIRENDSNKYIYVHYREDGIVLTKYVGEYSDELYNLVLNNSIKAKELKKHYPRLKELGIEVVSISCDKNKNQWLKAIEEDQPMWTQLFIDKKINGTDTADDYKVEFIPTLYLISPEGEILEKNPSMEEIETFVKKG